MKRALDVAVATVLLLLAMPLIVALAFATMVTLRASPFFSHRRVGRYGREFRFVKLRTLPVTAPAYADKYHIERVDMPRLCAFLRATHLDELPQLLLVIRGQMSLVGPRPEMPHLHETFAWHHRQAREALRPGCTGVWQVGIDNDRLINEAPEYDLFYAEHVSWRLDLWILWRTALLLCAGRRVSIDDVPDRARRPVRWRTLDLTDGPVEEVDTPQPALVP